MSGMLVYGFDQTPVVAEKVLEMVNADVTFELCESSATIYAVFGLPAECRSSRVPGCTADGVCTSLCSTEAGEQTI